jgi:hypothetical protein
MAKREQKTDRDAPRIEAAVNPEATEARAVQTLVESLAPFVARTDIGMSRTDFLRTVTSRILDELDP